MKEIFVDTSHFVALLHPSDQLHDLATAVEKDIEGTLLVTSDFVLVEVLNYFSKFPLNFKERISFAMQSFLLNPKIVIVECTRDVFRNGFDFYSRRLDHGYSLTDCTSMNIMRERGITEILTNDDHFEQEEFQILL
ncbi:MAG: type II toxin-antitoxin system VapC family toxin [Pyrinomonadaceae bacterium]